MKAARSASPKRGLTRDAHLRARREDDAVDVGRVLVACRAARDRRRGPPPRPDRAARRAERAAVDPRPCRRWARAGRAAAASAASAAPTSSSAEAGRGSQPLRPRSRADSRTTWATWSGVRSGRAARTQATAAATIGAEKLVPSTSRVAVLGRRRSSSAGGTAVRMPTAGRAEVDGGVGVGEGRRLESAALTAATVSTCGSEAGNSSGLPASNSLPAAATGMMPRADGELDRVVLRAAQLRSSRSSC